MTIHDNNVVNLSVSPESVSEGDGQTMLEVTGLMQFTHRSSRTDIALSVHAGTATDLVDYTAGVATLTLLAGDQGGTAMLMLTPIDDGAYESIETVRVQGVAQGGNMRVTSATVSINDDDTAPPPPPPPPTGAGPPQYMRAAPGNRQVTLTWNAPLYNGGSKITGYAHRYKENGSAFIWTWEDIPEAADARNYTVTGLTNGVEYLFEVRAQNMDGGGRSARAVATPSAAMATSAESEELPSEAALMGNYPNPFNPETTIDYALPQASRVRLAVYDLLGREAAELVDGQRPAGRHSVRFDAANLPGGAYIYRLEAGGRIIVRTMMLVK